MTSMGAAPAWRVTSQQQTTEISAGGQPVKGWNVGWTAKDGTSGSVFLAAADAGDVDTVRAAIQAEHDAAMARAGLTG